MSYVFQYGDDGLAINADTNLPFIDLTKITGLDSGEFRTSSRVREGMDGGFLDAEFENMRTIILEGNAYAEPSTAMAYLFSLKANYAPTRKAKPLYFDLPGIGRMVIYCKSLGVKFDLEQMIANGVTPVQIQLQAEDPTFYSQTVKTVTVVFDTAAPTLGRSYSRKYNYGYGASGQVAPGTLVVNNEGLKAAKAILRLRNISSPIVYSDTEDKSIRLRSSVSGNDFIELDLRNRTVTLNGTANRGNELQNPSTWFMVQPGINYFRMTGTIIGSNKPSMTVIFQDAYR